MKVSFWSRSSAPLASEDAKVTISEAPSTVRLTIKRRNDDGSYSRMAISLTKAEARELAHSILPPGPRLVPRV